MSITPGALSQVSVGSTTDSISATAPTGGVTPYSYQFYRSTTSGFTPGSANAVGSLGTALTLNDSGLIPSTQYYYKMVALDATSGTPQSATYSQLGVQTTQTTLSQNAIAPSTVLGIVDQAYAYNTKEVMIDPSVVGNVVPGCAVKLMPNSLSKVPTVVPCTADSDPVFGFVNFNFKDQNYKAGQMCEVSTGGNVLYLYSTGVISRGDQVTLDLTTNGGVADKVTSSGNTIVGYAYDYAPAAGTLIRVELKTPSFLVA
jgi:hypothetical protein